MPSTSKAQHNFMEMIAHNPGAARKRGPSKKVAEEFVRADKAAKPAAKAPAKKVFSFKDKNPRKRGKKKP
jgi:hypothetical protein